MGGIPGIAAFPAVTRDGWVLPWSQFFLSFLRSANEQPQHLWGQKKTDASGRAPPRATHSLASEAEDKYSHFLALPRLTQLWSPHQQLLQMLLLPSLSTSSTQKPNVFLERSRERRWVCYGKPSVVVLKQSLEIFLWQGELAELLASGEAAKRRENPKGWLDLLPLVPNSLTGLPQAAVPTAADNGL